MAINRAPTKLELLPTDIQTDIISRVAKFSRCSVRDLLTLIPPLAHTAAVPLVFKTLDLLHKLTVHPIASVIRYQDLMKRCLKSGNVQAHYIHGIIQYFENNNVVEGMAHLQVAADGSYNNTIYLCGIIKLCRRLSAKQLLIHSDGERAKLEQITAGEGSSAPSME